jgi:E3 ubiquitin-protein ligase RFWD2
MKRQHPTVLSCIGGSFEDKDSDFLCHVCFDLIEEAHVTHCGHTLCFQCILQSNKRCPNCSSVLPGPESVVS